MMSTSYLNTRLRASNGRSIACATASLQSRTCLRMRSKAGSNVAVRSRFGADVGLLAGKPHARRQTARSFCVQAVFEKFSDTAIKVVMAAQEEAHLLCATEVNAEHLLLGLLQVEYKTGYMGVQDVTLERVRGAVQSVAPGGRRFFVLKGSNLQFSLQSKRVFDAAQAESRRLNMNLITPEHINLALLSMDDPVLRKIYSLLRIDMEKMRTEASNRLKREHDTEQMQKKKAAPGASTGKQRKKALEEFCRDLCAEARSGKIDPVIGRTKEINRMFQILTRRSKNNPILVGEAGVGKSAIVEGLALALVKGCSTDGTPTPDELMSKRVMQLDVGMLIAGSKERGELELRVKDLITEVKEDGNVILMVDEVHVIVGAGSAGRSGGLDIANLVKPALSRGELQVIGATTHDEHRKHFERDTALERRFQPIDVDEPDHDMSLQILRGIQDVYERHHHCVYTEEALQAAVTLSARYIHDRSLPDKAIDLLDEAGSRARTSAQFDAFNEGRGKLRPRSAARDAMYIELQQVLECKDEAVRGALYEEAELLRERELCIKGKLLDAEDENPTMTVVGVRHIEGVVSAWTGIPVERMSEAECQKVLHLGSRLKERIIGQDDAVEATARALRRARSDLKDPARPIASLFFSGPTGVGKTCLAKCLADCYFGTEDALIRFDMSEYMERHSVSKLIGAPPGYVGYGDGGKLTQAVRRRPFCVLLFDEIEKAHPDVFHILLQIMEDGRLTDSQGRTTIFKDALIILTSNVGTSSITKGASRLGFSVSGAAEEDANYDHMRSMVNDELKQHFRPEFLNRLDEVIVFRQLQTAEARIIVDIMLSETKERLSALGIELEVSTRMMEKILEVGYSETYGARPLLRTVTAMIDDSLSDALLLQRVQEGDIAVVDVDADGDAIVYCKSAEEDVLAQIASQATEVVHSSVPDPSRISIEFHN